MPRPFKKLGSDLSTKSLARGELPLSNEPPKSTKELAEIASYSADQDAYSVVTRGAPGVSSQAGGKHLKGVPRKTDNPRSVAPLEVGTVVIIDWSFGFPFIDGTLPLDVSQARVASDVGATSNLAGDKSVIVPPDSTTDNSAAYYRDKSVPKEVLSGDQIMVSP